MEVYDQAAKAVPDNEKMGMYEMYIERAAEFFGVPKTMEIYEQARESGLPDKDVKTMCMKYAELEKRLGKIIRARSIYQFASQFADPRSDADFWKIWHDFEAHHGNEDTFREMLRIKHSLAASYSQMLFILPEHMMQKYQKLNLEETVDTLKRAGVAEDEMAALQKSWPLQQSMQLLRTVAEKWVLSVLIQTPDGGRNVTADNEEIELLEDSDTENGVEFGKKPVPDVIFGEFRLHHHSLREEPDQIGALERVKRQRRA